MVEVLVAMQGEAVECWWMELDPPAREVTTDRDMVGEGEEGIPLIMEILGSS